VVKRAGAVQQQAQQQRSSRQAGADDWGLPPSESSEEESSDDDDDDDATLALVGGSSKQAGATAEDKEAAKAWILQQYAGELVLPAASVGCRYEIVVAECYLQPTHFTLLWALHPCCAGTTGGTRTCFSHSLTCCPMQVVMTTTPATAMPPAAAHHSMTGSCGLTPARWSGGGRRGPGPRYPRKCAGGQQAWGAV
jgi:hypothetical protein